MKWLNIALKYSGNNILGRLFNFVVFKCLESAWKRGKVELVNYFTNIHM